MKVITPVSTTAITIINNKLLKIFCLVVIGSLLCTYLYADYTVPHVLQMRMLSKNDEFVAEFKDKIFEYTMNPPVWLCTKIDMLVIVLSAPKNFEKRQKVRDTWMYDKHPANILVRFIIGETTDKEISEKLLKEQCQYNDIIRYKFTDSYGLLPIKVHASFSYYNKYCSKAKYLLKTDDDTIIELTRLNFFIENMYNKMYEQNNRLFFCNPFRNHQPNKDIKSKFFMDPKTYNESMYPDFCQGCSYVVTREAVPELMAVTPLVKYIKLEDVQYGGVLRSKTNISIIDSKNFGYHDTEGAKKAKCYDNIVPYAVGILGVPVDKMKPLYKELKEYNFCSKNDVDYTVPHVQIRMSPEDNKFVAEFKDKVFEYTMSSSEGLCRRIDMLVIVISAPKYFEKRQKVRDTWMYDKNPANILVRFIIGDTTDKEISEKLLKEQRQYKDIIRYKFADSYNLLPIKVHASFSYYNKYCPEAKYLLKTDDDTIIELTRLNFFIESIYNEMYKRHNQLFVCNRFRKAKPFRNKQSKYFIEPKLYNESVYLDFCQGCSYVVTREAVPALLSLTPLVNYIKLEDVQYGGVIRNKTDISIVHSRNFGYGDIKSAKKAKCYDNIVPYAVGILGVPMDKMEPWYKELKEHNFCGTNGTKLR
ncbi:unnamed protein product [Bursaphelenchus okinawaensis]|uniref:Hexosyltransferase n=1 Tax=Bursaphelenchus okinawaensis TaxID=465554 RepID=A0A811L766_9BILA|nr:unnamed protein product [Bursaphelenchus okinawaensis]CAG9117100.1 unnamed protein product [Bursaphelenchus okinawaensis]